ncbi:hemolysin [Sebaldella termitidis]|jgi:hemolysin III|uniref:Channel protein, hemolysin III family n=1 Tax=Sebaldella termitidis (strain ATCC 33386 / NCTC 11300) TaxID=526218 RepID=D1AI25_SEBTE|nr:hemolysin III family protein [Sebaldella termitidis]ACZ08409.1 channel protein, hemolysin III family [Sebaldella termitidis ATCC 33386]SUI23722.1 hemolysin [Sebaldella termitidis]
MKIINKFPFGEELANFISHAAGGVLSVAALVILIIRAVSLGNTLDIVSFTIFGAALVLMYTTSSIFHALKWNKAKEIFEILDHSVIYVLIASTYTPFLLIVVGGKEGITLLVIEWLICILGIVFKSFFVQKFVVFSTLLYIIMGWLVVFVWYDLLANISNLSLVFLILGGLFYTIGTLFYMWRLFKYHHLVWHIFVIFGSIAHFFSVYFIL